MTPENDRTARDKADLPVRIPRLAFVLSVSAEHSVPAAVLAMEVQLVRIDVNPRLLESPSCPQLRRLSGDNAP